MRNVLILMCGIVMISSVAFADDTTETCAGGVGIVIEGAVADANGNKHKYCLSKNSMNWWNAYAWCDAQGRRLFDRSDCACSDTTADCRGKCPELVGVGEYAWIWTATSASASGAYHIDISSGNFDGGSNRERGISINKALCY